MLMFSYSKANTGFNKIKYKYIFQIGDEIKYSSVRTCKTPK